MPGTGPAPCSVESTSTSQPSAVQERHDAGVAGQDPRADDHRPTGVQPAEALDDGVPGGRVGQAGPSHRSPFFLAPITRPRESASRPTTVVPSAAVMIGRWIARGCAASAASQASRSPGSRARSMPSSLASFGPGDVPRLEPQPGHDVRELVGGRRLVEVAADGVLDAGRVQLGHGGAALAARRVEPDLHHSTSIAVAPVIARSSSYVVE